MANYISNIQIDTTGNAPVQNPQTISTVATATFIRQQFTTHHVDLAGTFVYNGPGGTLSGTNITSIKSYAGTAPTPGPLPEGTEFLESFFAYSNETFDPVQFASLTGPAAPAYLFRYGDTIFGSAFADKLASWDGDDTIFAGAGNDELFGGNGDDTLLAMTGKDRSTGGLGLDTFLYEEGDGKDRILDFNVKKDALLIDRDLARSLKTVTKFAEEKGSKVIFDFGGGDKLIVDNLTLAKFGKVAFSFLDIDN